MVKRLIVTLLLILLVGQWIYARQSPPDLLNAWSPYIVIHAPPIILPAYQVILPPMIYNQTLQGIRIDIHKDVPPNPIHLWLVEQNIDILAIVDNYFLFDKNIEEHIDMILYIYPNIKYLQIGNEITTILPKGGPQMTIEEYMLVLKRVYDHVVVKYPHIILLSQSTFGSGAYGAWELQRMADLGLRDMSPRKLIIGLNVYSIAAASNYAPVINESLRAYRIWVTETCIGDSNRHIDYVKTMYPFLHNTLRAERIYWYALWTGEQGQEDGCGLMSFLPNQLQAFTTRPLYKALIGLQ